MFVCQEHFSNFVRPKGIFGKLTRITSRQPVTSRQPPDSSMPDSAPKNKKASPRTGTGLSKMHQRPAYLFWVIRRVLESSFRLVGMSFLSPNFKSSTWVTEFLDTK